MDGDGYDGYDGGFIYLTFLTLWSVRRIRTHFFVRKRPLYMRAAARGTLSMANRACMRRGWEAMAKGYQAAPSATATCLTAPARELRHRQPSDKMLAAAELAAEGKSNGEIAELLKVNKSTVGRWLVREDMRAIRAAKLQELVAAMAPRAYAVLHAQLDDPNPWVAQGAARELIRLYNLQQGVSDSNVVVTFGGMPQPGAPGSAGALEEDGAEAIEADFSDA